MTMMEPSKKPLNVLIKQLHGNIEVVLKNGYEYKGKNDQVRWTHESSVGRRHRIQRRPIND